MNSFFESAAPCCLGIVFFLGLFGFVAFLRYMGYRETLALAEKGLVKPDRRPGNATLFWGIGFTAVGAALLVGLWPIGFIAGTRFPLGLGPWLLFGLLPMFFGLGLILFYVLTHESTPKNKTPVVAPVVAPRPVEPVMVVTPAPVVVSPAPAAVPPAEPPVPPAEPPTNSAP